MLKDLIPCLLQPHKGAGELLASDLLLRLHSLHCCCSAAATCSVSAAPSTSLTMGRTHDMLPSLSCPAFVRLMSAPPCCICSRLQPTGALSKAKGPQWQLGKAWVSRSSPSPTPVWPVR